MLLHTPGFRLYSWVLAFASVQLHLQEIQKERKQKSEEASTSGKQFFIVFVSDKISFNLKADPFNLCLAHQRVSDCDNIISIPSIFCMSCKSSESSLQRVLGMPKAVSAVNIQAHVFPAISTAANLQGTKQRLVQYLLLR